MFEVILKIPPVMLFRSVGFPHLLPFNLTVSLTSRCNSRALPAISEDGTHRAWSRRAFYYL